MSLEDATKYAEILAHLSVVVAGFWALYLYWDKSRAERAKWAEDLHSKFFEKDQLKSIRNALDCDPNDSKDAALAQQVAKLCENAERSAEEGTNFTDYLNFFELVAYLKESGQLKGQDVDALFKYYLCTLKKHRCVVAYINRYGFKHLQKLLSDYGHQP